MMIIGFDYNYTLHMTLGKGYTRVCMYFICKVGVPGEHPNLLKSSPWSVSISHVVVCSSYRALSKSPVPALVMHQP